MEKPETCKHDKPFLYKGHWVLCYCMFTGKIKAIFDKKDCPLTKRVK